MLSPARHATPAVGPVENLRRASHATAVVAALLLFALVWQIVAAFQSVPWIVDRLTADDTYLLLQTCRGWSEHGFPTFDGLHRTNGFQALWGLMIYGLATVLREPLPLLRGTLVLVAVLNLATGVLLWRCARRLSSEPATGVWTVGLWTCAGLSGKPTMIGLENALLAPLVVAAILGILRLRWGMSLVGEQRRRVAPWLAVAALCGAAVWARLDFAVIVAVVWIGLGFFALRHKAICGYLAATALIGAFVIGLIGFNLWAGGTPTPVSGMMKRMIAARIEPVWTPAVLGQAALDAAAMTLKHFAYGIGGVWPPAFSTLVRGLIVATALVVIVSRWMRPDRWVGLWLIALLAHACVIRLFLGWYHADTNWYYAPQHVSACVLLGLCFGRVTQRVLRGRGAIVAPAIVGFSKAPLAILALFVPPGIESAALNQVAAAEWLRLHTPRTDRVAAWNAGHVAYFSARTVINLDGLVNDAAFLERVRAGDVGESYLDSVGVRWVVDRAETVPARPGLYWSWLPMERWKEAARIGHDPHAQHLIVTLRRR